ncbi:PREDICTED: UDP-glucuronosyltransferase 2B17-like isoform X1 [Chinchilla lanigera]|uniref:UDP-glucuronosyltransferase n=2 Tax=Chinchilla lanigera TaxID=34839 RepID=A0A8C2V3J6_CHILA|nr:PREDICTED: UDP-glucuronosyltransferase 2B17-like isoform X1 [Chinchilla lanigera]
MSRIMKTILLLLHLCCYFSAGRCGKVLVWPMDYSHWLNIQVILTELVQRGHEVTVLRPSSSVFLYLNSPSDIKFETFLTSSNTEDMKNFFERTLDTWIYTVPKDTYWKHFPRLQGLLWEFSDVYYNITEGAVRNKKLMTKLQDSKFDVLLADAIFPGGDLMAELLKIPLVYTLRFSPGYTYEKYNAGLLFPPSYVPVILSRLSSQMTFMERVKNLMHLLYFDFWFQTFNEKKWSQFYTEILGRPTTLSQSMAKAEMWLIRSYWDLEFPRPTLPNTEFVGGLHCKPAKPLPKEMEEFVQSSGEHGIVVFSLGSMVHNLTEERANVIALALAQLPQKVIWRYSGKKPDTLQPNTQLYEWIPQNDLLGHPKTKAFVTHGGANGIYDAINHGVPMVGIPLFGEQHDNIAHMEAKGAAVVLDFMTMSTADLVNALKEVMNNPSFKENVMWLSTIHHDQPMKPLDRAAFWIEFVMRHKRANHLRPLAQNLTWYQYHSLDVIGFLLACVVTVTLLVTKCCFFCYQKIVKTGKKKKE